jgi:hypothetical protein
MLLNKLIKSHDIKMTDLSLDEVKHKFPVFLLQSSSISANPKFSYLLSRLEGFYYSFYTHTLHTLTPSKSPRMCKNIFINLHLLLGEIIMTLNPKEQIQALEKAYNWFASLFSKVEEQAVILRKVNDKPKIRIPSLIERSKTSFRRIKKLNLPREEHEVNREEILDNIKYQHFQMIESEKLSLDCGESRDKLRKNGRSLNKTPVERAENEETKKSPRIISKTPDIFIETNEEEVPYALQMDFRAFSHKSRGLAVGMNRRYFSKQIPAKHKEIEEITRIKLKMAKNKMNISINCLENALSTHHKVPIESITHLDLPKGGEMLFKSAKLPKTPSKLKKSKKNAQ